MNSLPVTSLGAELTGWGDRAPATKAVAYLPYASVTSVTAEN